MNQKDGSDSNETCHFVPNVLAVRPEDLDRSRETLGAGEADNDALQTIFAHMPDEAGQIRELVALLEVDDPHGAAQELARLDEPIDASPVHGIGFQSHAKFMSGPGPEELPEPRRLDSRGEGDPERIVAVIDSGIVEENDRPDWMKQPNVISEPEFEDAAGRASHGTFVTSIIRQVAPDLIVSFAAARPDLDSVMVTSAHGAVDDPPTTELDVLGAVLRLINRHGQSPWRVRALNLSLGAPRCTDGPGFLLTLRSALDHWRAHFGQNPPIFAAGGNSSDASPVYPAAFSCVRGVAAAAEGGDQQVWEDDGSGALLALMPGHRTWIEDVAPGLRVVGLSGRDPDHTVAWSGSSFATAVASALSVSGSTYEVDSGLTYWKDRAVSYSIPGLSYD